MGNDARLVKVRLCWGLFFLQKLVLCHLPKEELAKYLCCYLKLEFNNAFKIRERKRRTRLLPVSAVEGTYSATGIQVAEVAINNRVARVHMEPLNQRGIPHKIYCIVLILLNIISRYDTSSWVTHILVE